MKIIYGPLPYAEALEKADLPTLSSRRTILSKTVFVKMKQSENKLHHLLPKNTNRNYELRSTIKYQLPQCKTERYKSSFLPYSLFHYQ